MSKMIIETETVNRWRKRRGKLLASHIKRLACLYRRKITVLDIGGRPLYWANVDTGDIASITVLNNDESELDCAHRSGMFVTATGDACGLGYTDKSFDLVHSNSVIEHVGDWQKMSAMANEAVRVGRAGWVQTPAWEFPIEPHFRMPFIHWLAAPARRAALRIAPCYRNGSLYERRSHADRINLLSRGEVRALFPHPGIEILTERFALLPKSYMVTW